MKYYTHSVLHTPRLLRDMHVFLFHVIRLLILFNMFHWPWVNNIISMHCKTTKINTHYHNVNMLPFWIMAGIDTIPSHELLAQLRWDLTAHWCKMNNTTSSEARRFMVDMLLLHLNMIQILVISYWQALASWGKKFTSLNSSTWRNTGSSMWNDPLFEQHIRFLRNANNHDVKWKCVVKIVIKIRLLGFAITMLLGLCKQYVQCFALRAQDWDFLLACALVHRPIRSKMLGIVEYWLI